MATMMQAFSDRTFLDDQAKPIVSGRVTFYVHDSNVLADVFTLEGDEYVSATNPQILDEAGRLQASIFTELGIYDVKVEKNNGDATFSDFDLFEIGIDAKLDDVGRDEVDDIEALADLDPDISSQVVTVKSYPRRDYIWDPGSTDIPDSGIVVDSNVKGEGNWILLWDCPYLPSSVYGVIDGDISNINALLGYSSIVGSFHMSTPPVVRFERGNYNLVYSYVSAKTLAFDKDAVFTGELVVPCDIETFGPRTAPIGNVRFTGTGCTAHSSWFRDVDDFWHCGADILVVDAVNHFDTGKDKLKTAVDLSGKTVIGSSTKVGTYVNGSYFKLALDSTVPNNFFDPDSDFVRVAGYGFGDDMFRTTGSWAPGLINQGYRVQWDVVPDLDLFQNANRWLSIMLERRDRLSSAAWADYTLDCQNRTVDSAYLRDTSFTTVKNANFTGTLTLAGYGTTLDNVTANLTVNWSHSNSILTLLRSNVSINRFHTGIASVASVDSNISVIGAEGFDPCDTAISVQGGSFSGYVKMSEDHCNSYTANQQVIFRDCLIANGFAWRLNYLQMVNCTHSGKIDLYPSASGSNFYYNLALENCKFVGGFRLHITYYWDATHPHYECSGTAVKFNMMRIVGNRFDTTDAHAIKMTQWHVKSADPFMFATGTDTNMGVWEYSGNSGNCPSMTPPSINNSGNWGTSYTNPVGPAVYKRSNDSYYLFMPYYYLGDGITDSAPKAMLDPANPGNRVQALNQGDDWNVSWTQANVWYANAASTPSLMEDEDYNNRFICYVWLSRAPYSTSTPDYDHPGFTTFARCGKFA